MINRKPGDGFAITKEAAAPAVNDPYQTYNRSVLDQDEVWNALLTESGRQALGA